MASKHAPGCPACGQGFEGAKIGAPCPSCGTPLVDGDQAYRQWEKTNRDALLAFHGVDLPPAFVRRRQVAVLVVLGAIVLMFAIPDTAAFSVPTRVMLVCAVVTACAHWLAGNASKVPVPFAIAALLAALVYVEAATVEAVGPLAVNRAFDIAATLIRYVLAAGFLVQASLLYGIAAWRARRSAWNFARGRTIDL